MATWEYNQKGNSTTRAQNWFNRLELSDEKSESTSSSDHNWSKSRTTSNFNEYIIQKNEKLKKNCTRKKLFFN